MNRVQASCRRDYNKNYKASLASEISNYLSNDSHKKSASIVIVEYLIPVREHWSGFFSVSQ